MSSADTTTEAAVDEVGQAPSDDRRDELVSMYRDELGDDVVGTHVRPGDDVWVRVNRDAWVEAARFSRHGLRMDLFDFLSGIDWLPSSFGRGMDSQEDIVVQGIAPKELPSMTSGYAGGETRFQVLARVFSPTGFIGVNLKADLPEDDLSVGTWVRVYAGANWHERECREMFGFDFVGHPHPSNLYLPGGFEGYPLRKDFPLLSRRVKPWPGIVDVEPMPGATDGDEGDE